MSAEDTLYRWSKSVDGETLDWWETELIAAGVAYVVEKTANRKRWRLSAYETDRSAVEKLKKRFGGSVSTVRPEDWQHQAVDENTPLKIRDRFVVTQHSGKAERKRLAAEFPGREVLSFPPRLAFGTGGHPTTAGCLRLLTDAARELPAPWPMLDLGCGSGILAIAAAKLGAQPVVAVEFDPLALEVARENAGRHACKNAIQFIETDAVEWIAEESGSENLPSGGYPVIAANLFSDLLVALLPHFPKHLASGGTVILSGLLNSQTGEVTDAAAKAGIQLDRFLRRGKWVAAAGSLAR